MVGRVLLVRAFDRATPSVVSRIVELTGQARQTAGRPILYWPIFGESPEMPTPEGRAAMQNAAGSLFANCEAMTLVILGRSVKQTLLYVLLRGMITIGGYSDRVRIVTSLAEAVAAADDPEVDLSTMRKAALAAGIIEAERLGETRP